MGSAGRQENGLLGKKKGRKELAKADEGKALSHSVGGRDRSRSGVQSCKFKAESSEDALALKQMEKYI